jgi:hypothetical protein
MFQWTRHHFQVIQSVTATKAFPEDDGMSTETCRGVNVNITFCLIVGLL